MKISKITSGLFSTNSYFLQFDEYNYLIDAPDQNEKMVELIKKAGKLDAILLTHGHFDHTLGLKSILSLFPNIPVYLEKEDWPMLEKDNKKYMAMCNLSLDYKVPQSINLLPYEERIPNVEIIKSPGHTPGSVSIYLKEESILFSGDTLFSSGYGRTDLGGSYSLLLSSLKKILTLSEDTRVEPGHGGFTTIGREKAILF